MTGLVVVGWWAKCMIRGLIRADGLRTWFGVALWDEMRVQLPLGAAVGATAILVSLAAYEVGLAALGVFIAPLLVTQVAFRRYAGIRATYLQTVRALARVTEVGGYVEDGHARRVGQLAVVVGRDLGMSEPELLELEYAALMHDIGQLSLRDPIPGGATVLASPEEQRRIAELGASVIDQAGVLDGVAEIVRYQSWPWRGRDREPPVGSRIIRAANAFDDLVGASAETSRTMAALEWLRLDTATEYDPRVVDALAKVAGRRHRSHRYAARVLNSVLVANRGEIARRILATARRLGIRAVAVYSEADADLPFVAEADEAVLIGPAPPGQSYLDAGAVLAAARRTGAAAIHPGYGFLAENPAFARRVLAEGLIWVGPPPEAIEQMGDKINARNLMARAGVPVSAGTTEPVTSAAAAAAEAARIGYPVMVKAAAGGGGIGMSAVTGPAGLAAAFETARTRAERFFGDPAILLERYIDHARHVEVQILGLADGRVVALGERDCSVQRRHQKVAEQAPSPGVGPALRARMLAAAVRAGAAVGYRGAGTVECLVDPAADDFVFLEMNTRLQVEHPVTELVTCIDLVEQQFRIAAGADVSFDPAGVRPRGHALELRVYAA